MTAHAAPVPLGVSAARGPVLPLALARGVAFVALAAFGVLHWMVMLEPAATMRAWYALGAGLVAMLGLLGAERLTGRRRTLAALLASLVALALALLAGGVADELLRPDRWGELFGGVGRGLSALPGARVPYRGLDQWTRTVIALGGSVLVVAAAMLAFWPRRGRMGFPLAALVALVTLYAVPMVALDFTHEFLRGALLALLVVAFLRLEKLRRADMPAAAGIAAVALLLGLMVAPALNGSNPWWDYETWALETASSKSDSFDWNHNYGPLKWPRDGRELLRIKARVPAYWKAQSLDLYDGKVWRSAALAQTQAPDFQLNGIQTPARWRETIKVTLRNLRSRTFISAGVPTDTPKGLRGVSSYPTGVAGIIGASRVLRRGDSYTLTVYAPRPSGREIQAATTDYQPWLAAYRTVYIRDGRGRLAPDPITGVLAPAPLIAELPAWGTDAKPMGTRADAPLNPHPESAVAALRRSDLWRSWNLVQQIKRESPTPYQFVANVEDYLSKGFSYSETPPKSAETLDGFLFKARQGYCQQFSGSEALLLRLAGIPARVATGFSQGAYDSKAKEWVVRDLDAHSWVEVYFPGYGWIPRDPTPAAAPSRRAGSPFASRSGGPVAGDVPQPGFPGTGDARAHGAATDGGIPWVTAILLALLAVAAAFALRLYLKRRPLMDRSPLHDLQRALRRARLDAGPATTLAALERRFAGTPTAAAFVRTLREERYRGAADGKPTGAQRRGLRHELARGGGPRGWLRAWWALPPRPRR